MNTAAMWTAMFAFELILLAVPELVIYGPYVRESYLAGVFIHYAWGLENAPLFTNKINIYLKNMEAVSAFFTILYEKGIEIAYVDEIVPHHSDPNYETFDVEVKFLGLQLILCVTLCKRKKKSFFIKDKFSFTIDSLYMCNNVVGLAPYYKKITGIKDEACELNKILANIRNMRAPIFQHCASDIKSMESIGWTCTSSTFCSKKVISFMKAPGETCLICLGDLDFSIGHKRGCCNAHYHHKCYKKMLHTQDKCPMCRDDFRCAVVLC